MRPRSKQAQIHRLHPMALALARAGIIGTLACGLPLSAAAQQATLPTGGSVVAGSATISNPTATSRRITQSSDKAIINWQGFSIGKPNSVQFVQPGSGSVVLNRVVGDNPSAIYGSLSANGQVFLVNPRGIYFGPGASLDVGGLVASTLDISNKDFLDGNYVFSRSDASGSGAGVTNAGTINTRAGGYVVLAGDYANNSGVIRANVGQVALAAGNKVTLDLNGDHLINLAVNEKTLSNLAGVSNSGKIVADGGKVVMTAATARNLAGTVVNNTGVIQATGTVEKNGAIYLMGDGGDVSNSGTLNAGGVNGGSVTVQSKTGTTLVSGDIDVTGTAGHGGTAQILGERVGLTDHADVNASGTTGGGTVLVGGDYQGKNAAVQNAFQTAVGSEATINADATQSGDGGKVVVWANDSTRYYGNISAKGGSQSGDGGKIEVSGKQGLAFAGSVDTTAAYGQMGTLLLDPDNINVQTGGGATYSDVSTFNAQPGTTQAIDPSALNAVGASVTLQATNNIDFNSAVNLATAGAGLTAQAGNSVTVNAGITTNNGAINLYAGDLGTTPTPGGKVAITSTGALNSGGANINLLAYNGNVEVAGTINAGAGNVTLTTAENGAAASAINDGFRDIFLSGNITGNVVTLNAANGINQTAGGITATGLLARGSFGNSDSAILLTGPNNDIGTLAIEKNAVSPCTTGCPGAGTGNVVVVNVNNGANKLTVGSVGGVNGITTKPTDSAVTLTAGDIDVNQAINTGSGTVVLQPYTSATTVTVGTATGVANEFALTQTDLDWITAGALRLGSTANTATMTINATIHTPDTAATPPAPGTWNTLTLLSGGDITETAAGALGDANNPITNLAVVAAGNVTLTSSANNVATLAANVTGAGNSFQFVNSGAFAVGHVKKGIVPNYDFTIHDLNPSPPPPEPIDGITTNGGNVYVETGNNGALGLAKDISAGAGTVEISSGGGVTNSGGSIQAAGLLLEGAGSFALTQSGNDVGTLAAEEAGGQLNLSYTGMAGSTLTIGAVNDHTGATTVNGITTGGNVTLTADNMTFTQGISAGNVTLTSSDAARTINLGSGAGGLDLTDATLDNV
ncbi:MAG TPA: filamentous hemagglutinin N-terminal domain-containing protein, partial [Burkholderiales bacterium]|nr:filamentous hemagglutinin N-terminal domain-containing protein [Burkholderiales bacterium]